MINNKDLMYLPDNELSTIYKGNADNMYLGILDKVPVKVGTNIVNQEKIWYEVRILCLEANKSRHMAKRVNNNSHNAIQKSIWK